MGGGGGGGGVRSRHVTHQNPLLFSLTVFLMKSETESEADYWCLVLQMWSVSAVWATAFRNCATRKDSVCSRAIRNQRRVSTPLCSHVPSVWITDRQHVLGPGAFVTWPANQNKPGGSQWSTNTKSNAVSSARVDHIVLKTCTVPVSNQHYELWAQTHTSIIISYSF